MKIITLRFLPPDSAWSLFGCICVKDPSWVDEYVVNHESIHAAQQREMLWIPFYVIYVIEFLAKSLWYRSFHRGYMSICHEREAYFNDHDLDYLNKRKHFAEFRVDWKKRIDGYCNRVKAKKHNLDAPDDNIRAKLFERCVAQMKTDGNDLNREDALALISVVECYMSKNNLRD
jgi:hypothetical protein